MITIDGGAYSVWPFTAGLEPGQAVGNLPGPYDFRGYRCETRCVATNKPGFVPYRGVARTGVCFAMDLLMDALAREVGDDNITVNAITPGFTASETQVGGSDPAYMARMAAMNERKALKRTQMPEDLVGVLLFLLSDASAYITGHCLPIDGGWTAGFARDF